jgi:hypothetical protein
MIQVGMQEIRGLLDGHLSIIRFTFLFFVYLLHIGTLALVVFFLHV